MTPPPTSAPDDALLDQLLDTATRAAAAAVELIHERRPEQFRIDQKSSSTDLVTEMDTASEALIRSVIAESRPADVVVGEEGGELGPNDSTAATGVTWWIDPIDGTTNYVYDHPGYNVSIAAGLDGQPVVGVVADPTHGRTYSASRGRGAFCNGRELRLADPPPVPEMLVATGFAYDPGRRGRQGSVVAALVPQIRDIRRMGAAAMDLCSVASGRVDAYYEAGLSIWDLAAGQLIASEAGAAVGAVEGGAVRPESVLVTHPDRFDELSALLVSLGAHEV